MIRALLRYLDNRTYKRRLRKWEAQTTAAASILAKHGAERRKADEKARRDRVTEALRVGGPMPVEAYRFAQR